MTSVENKHYYTHSPDQILDTDPVVSMDISIGDQLQPGEIVHVNYPALRNTLSEVGAPLDNSDSSIAIEGSGEAGVAGWHAASTRKTAVRFKRRSPSSMQKTLQHELTHYVDLLENPEQPGERRSYGIGSVAIKSSLYAAPINILTSAAVVANSMPKVEQAISPAYMSEGTYDVMSQALEYTQLGSSVASLAAGALGGIFYYANKRERIARKGERKKLPSVVSIQS